jgi:excisionase family DNA binding protein
MTRRLLTTAEVAQRLGLSPRTVRWACSTGRMQADRYGRDWLVDEREIAWYELRHLGRFQKAKTGKP